MIILRVVALSAALLTASGAFALEPAAAEPVLPDDAGEGWRLSIAPYLWIPAQDGDVALKGFSASVDLNIGDTFDAVTDHFNFAIAFHAELQMGDFSLFADVMYLSLETEGVTLPETTATVRQDTGVFELGVAYRVVDLPRENGSVGFALEPLAGVRAHYLSLDFDPRGARSSSDDKFWADVIVGARAVIGLHDAVNLRLRGDIGAGGSDFTWSALAGLQVLFSENASPELGYRALDTDYSTGSGSDRFKYDVLLHGPHIGLNLTF